MKQLNFNQKIVREICSDHMVLSNYRNGREAGANSDCQTCYLLLINTELSGICYPSGNTIKSGSKCFLLIALFMSQRVQRDHAMFIEIFHEY